MNDVTLSLIVGMIGALLVGWCWLLQKSYPKAMAPLKVFCWFNWVYWLYVYIGIWHDSEFAFPYSYIVGEPTGEGYYRIVAVIVCIALISRGPCFIRKRR